MTANFIFMVAAALFTLGGYALVLASIKYGFKWAKVAEISLLKAFGFHLLFLLVSVLVGIVALLVFYVVGTQPSEAVLNTFAYPLQLLIAVLAIRAWYRVGFWRAALALIPFFVSSFALLGFALLIIRPFTYEAFVIPTNAMAPTLLGNHLEAPCPNCGSPAYGAPPDPRRSASPDGLQMICSKEMKTVNVKTTPTATGEGDKILVSKLVTPKRWDLIVFRAPPDPSVNYVKRLIGMPGEKVEIRDGTVWINDEKMEPPESIRKIHYSPTIETHGQVVSGPGSVPVTLGPDEYFVLGDFVDQSSDSRFWEKGMPGHPPYAVPASNIVGVVINIYWPPSRWTSFR